MEFCESTCDLTTYKNIKTSTPNTSFERTFVDCAQSPDVSIIENIVPLLITHDSNEVLDEGVILQCTVSLTDPTQEQTTTNELKCRRDQTSAPDQSVIKRCNDTHLDRYKFDQDLTEDQLDRTCALKLKGDQKLTKAQPKKLCELTRKRLQEFSQNMACELQDKRDLIQVPEKSEVSEEVFLNDRAARSSSSVPLQVDKRGCALEESRSSVAESVSGSCASSRAQYYQNKLLATLQILQNKEETVRVQAQSLAVAEARIAALTARSTELKREIERKKREIQTLRKTEESRIKTDVSVTAQIQEMDDQENIVTTLQNNLGVIEELYRECFYETVKQENLIEMLRKSYLDVRLKDKEKSDRIFKLHNVINTQKWSLDKCQDVAAEVDNLKMEISNFINSSNNDSGMWEESVVGGLSEDLHDIAAQLLRLRELLTVDCTCGLEEENEKLRQNNHIMETEISDLRTKISDLEVNLLNKDILEKQCQEQIEKKESELNCIRERLHSLEQNTKEKSSSCDMLSVQLTQTQAQLEGKTLELSKTQKQCELYEKTIRAMKEELNKSEQITQENLGLREELCAMSRRSSRLQRHANCLQEELMQARAHCEHVETCYSDKAASVVELERQLDAAHTRGAELCAEAGRVVRAVRGWARRMREMHREQEEQIKQKECRLRLLQQQIGQRRNGMTPRTCPSQIKRCCSARPVASALTGEAQPYVMANSTSEMDATCSKCVPQMNEKSFASPGACVKIWESTAGQSASEIASCSSTPVPPKRTLKKKPSPSYCGLRRCRWASPQSVGGHDVPPPCRRCRPSPSPASATAPAPLSPGEEMFSRIESLSAALADGYRRWSRRGT